MKPILSIMLLVFATGFAGTTSRAQDSVARSIHQSAKLTITQLSRGVYLHTSYFHSETFGKVPCNGMVVTDQGTAVVFDTPADDSSTSELIDWIEQKLHSRIKAVIPTHFHEDCLGGLKAFHKRKIPSYASRSTIALAKSHGFSLPQHSFKDSLALSIGKSKVYAVFHGAGHTADNVIGYYPKDEVIFGGCLIKEIGADKGNLEDADVIAWPHTVRKVKASYPNARVVIPGHGTVGNTQLLDYTIELFSKK